jgi:hypothetical protein
MEAARNRVTPAATTLPENTVDLGSRRCRSDTPMTPTATPSPRAVTKMPKPAVPAPRTSRENSGPSGTSIPPPIRPQPRPSTTARTTGVMKMNDHPSLISLKTWPRSMPSVESRSRMCCRLMGMVAMMKAAIT